MSSNTFPAAYARDKKKTRIIKEKGKSKPYLLYINNNGVLIIRSVHAVLKINYIIKL